MPVVEADTCAKIFNKKFTEHPDENDKTFRPDDGHGRENSAKTAQHFSQT